MDKNEAGPANEPALTIEQQALHGRVMQAAVEDATQLLYTLEKELKKLKHPVLSGVVGELAFSLDNVRLPWGIDALERDIEEGKKGLQVGYIPTPEMFEADKISAYASKRRRSGDLVLAEIIATRAEVDRLFDKIDAAEGDEAKAAALAAATSEVRALHEATLLKVVEGGVDPIAVASAALGWRKI